MAVMCAAPVGCDDDDDYEGHFDGPVAAAVLYPDQGGPWDDPVGFVSNSRSGRITPLDLKHARLLSDDLASSFLRASYVATGRTRILGDIVVWAPDTRTVTLFVADSAHGVLVEAPYVLDVETGTEGGETWVDPVEPEPEASDPIFVDADDSGDTCTLSGLTLRQGYTTTEDWTVTYNGEAWTVEGSRSGRQDAQAVTGEAYHTGYRELEFTITGSATEGDRFEFSTDTGVVEYDLGGTIQALAARPDQELVAASLFDRETAETGVVLFAPEARAVVGELPLPEEALPYRTTWSADGERLFVADAGTAVVYEVVIDAEDPASSEVYEIPVRDPVADVAHASGDSFDRLVVASAIDNRADLYDLEQAAFVDINTYTDEIDGMLFESPIMGLHRVPVAVLTPETSTWGGRISREVVAVSLFEGRLVLMDVETGCLAQDDQGPRSYEGGDGYGFVDYGDDSDPYLWEDEATGKHLAVNDCAGVAREQSWEIIFDEIYQYWTVEGEISGMQENVARADERYVSDVGEISFTVMAGALPATDGDRYQVTVRDGVLDFDGDIDDDGERERTFEFPGRPVPFWFDAGPTGGGWNQLDRRVYALWPITNSDLVARARLTSGQIQVLWD